MKERSLADLWRTRLVDWETHYKHLSPRHPDRRRLELAKLAALYGLPFEEVEPKPAS